MPLRLVVISTLLGCLSGCGQSSPPLSYVKGRILIGNQPLANAHVFFAPVADIRQEGGIQHGLESVGKTNSAGEFTLKHDSGAYGAEIGTHRVSVQIPGKSIHEIPPNTPAAEIRQQVEPRFVALGEWSTYEVTNEKASLDINLPEGALGDKASIAIQNTKRTGTKK